MNFKLIGCILLIVGTCIGAGMLGLPIATGQLGFIGSVLLLVGCWAVMTAGAFLILEVHLWLPETCNLITMAKETVGIGGQTISWITYLLLLYSLLCAYIAGGSDLFHNLLQASGISIPSPVAATIFTLIFGAVVFMGIRIVDYANRGLITLKFAAFFILVALLTPFIDVNKLNSYATANQGLMGAMMMAMVSFGYAAIVPSLRGYFKDDIRSLKIAIIVGSLIPLFCYIAWEAAILGVVPREGNAGLFTMLSSKTANSDLVNAVSTIAAESKVTFFAKLFTSVCVLTSFLGVGLCLADFLSDGLKIEKIGKKNILLHFLVLTPPLVIVLFMPNVFIKALEYSGLYCVILLILLPAIMVWFGRYRTKVASGFRVPGGKPLLLALMGLSFVLIIYGLQATLAL